MIFNINLEFLTIIDNFTSFRWVRRYHKIGEFELHIPYTEESAKYLIQGNVIYKGNNEGGFIEKIEYSLDEKGNEVIKALGRDLTAYLQRRINYDRVIFKGTSEVLMRELVSKNCIYPNELERVIPKLFLRTRSNIQDLVEYQNTYGNIAELCEQISLSNGIGYGIFFDTIKRELYFHVYKGKDRSVLQSINPATVFSRDMENIINQVYVNSVDNYKNFALIGGAGEDESRRKTTVGTAKGIERFEIFVDARDLSDKETITQGEEQVEVIMDDTKYIPILQERGKEKLSEYQLVKTLESQINVNSNLIYKVDYDLGDIITCLDKKWGLLLNVRITEIEEVYEQNGMQINVTFGNNIPTLIDKIKANMR